MILACAYVLCFGTLAHFALGGFSFYLTPLIERPRHELFWVFKPGGELGHLFGWVGSAMMTIMLAYSLRKRVSLFRRLGPLNIWLDYHILLGLVGPLFIVLHSSFKVGGLVSLSFWSMIAVMLSGILGRFIYRLIPRSRAGDELSLSEVESLDRELNRRLTEDLGQPPEIVERIERLAMEGQDPSRSLLAIFFGMIFDPSRLRRRLKHLHLGAEFERTALRKALLRRRLLFWDRLRELFHYWHVFHKPFAVIMYLFMVVHIAVAWSTGYGWIG